MFDRMKRIALAALLFLLAFTGRAADEAVTITGEVVDLHCYTSRGAHGEEHAGCANACLSRDVPAGILTEDGTVYLLLSEKSVSIKEKVAGKAGKKITAHGQVVERGGLKALKVVSID